VERDRRAAQDEIARLERRLRALLGVPPPKDFGYAPPTIAYREGKPCVR
jgi:hypothetical protein